MDWAKQSEEMINNWTQMQKQMMDAYFTSMAELTKSPSEKLWDQTIAAGKQAIQNTLKVQGEWIGSWVEYLQGIEGMPKQALDSAEQFQQMSRNWLDTQNQLWESWFEMLSQVDVNKMSAGWTGAAPTPLQAWQDSTRKIMDAQLEWMQAWAKFYSGETPTGESTGGESDDE